MDVGGEGGDDDALLAAGEQPLKGLAYHPLAHGVARPLHVGGVRQQGQDPLLAQLPQAAQVDDLPVNGGGVDLEVAGVDDDAHAGMDGEGHRVRDGVVDVDELHVELAHPDHLPGLHGDELGLLEQAVLLQLQLDEARGQPGAVHRHIHLAQHIGDGPDVVLVSVGDDQAPDAGLVLHQVCHVGDDQVDAVHVVAGKGHAAVHHDDLAAVLINRHILADLVETAKRDDLHFFCQISTLLFLLKTVTFQWQKCNENRREECPGTAPRFARCRDNTARYVSFHLIRICRPQARILIFHHGPAAAVRKKIKHRGTLSAQKRQAVPSAGARRRGGRAGTKRRARRGCSMPV